MSGHSFSVIRRCLGECDEGGNGGGEDDYKKGIVPYPIGMILLEKIQKTKIWKALLKHFKNVLFIYLFIYFNPYFFLGFKIIIHN